MRCHTVLPSIFLATVVLALAGCARPQPPLETAPTPPASTFRPTASVIDLMAGQIDPAADYLWESVATITGPKGTEEKQPRTDKEWAVVRRQALTLVEASNLLMMEGRKVGLPGQNLENPPGQGDLTPAQSDAALQADRATFVAYSRVMQDAALASLKAIEARDAAALLQSGGDIDEACELCHKKYWYPGGGALAR